MAWQLAVNRKFGPFFWTQFLGALNDNVFKNALVILFTFRGLELLGLSTPQLVAFCGGLFILPFMLFSGISGQISDRFPKHLVIRWVKVSECFIMLLAVCGFLTEHNEVLLGCLFLMGLHSTFFGPVKFSILPEILSKNELVAGNAAVEFGTFLAILLGTICGGMMAIDGSLEILCGMLLGISILGLLMSFYIQPLRAAAPDAKIDWHFLRPTISVLKISRKNKTVARSIVGISWFWAQGAVVLSLLPVLCKEELHTTESSVTFFLALFSVGIGIGSLLCERICRNRPIDLGLISYSALSIVICMLTLYFSTHALVSTEGETVSLKQFLLSPFGAIVSISFLSLAIFNGLFIVPLYTLIQAKTDPHLRSQIVASNNVLNSVWMVLATAVLMILYRFGFTAHQLFLVLAVVQILIFIRAYKWTSHSFYRLMCEIMTPLFYNLKIRGDQSFSPRGPCVVVSNHVTFVDWMLLSAIVKTPMRFIMSYEYLGFLGMGFFFRHCHVIPIATLKEDQSIQRKAFEEMDAAIQSDDVLCIFPEGGLTPDGQLQAFRRGIERILKSEKKVEVHFISLHGLWGSRWSRWAKHEKKNGFLSSILRWRRDVDVEIKSSVTLTARTVSELEQHYQKFFVDKSD